MHRSGTSIITRGLQTMSVELGNRLLPPQDDNITGFWEDVDINKFNIEMLHILGKDWHFLTPVRQSDVKILRQKGYIQRAVELLQEKTSEVDIFGFKDPRVAKLILFWKEVFTYGEFDVSYVLPIRNPLSVFKSLEKRHGFDREKSSLLWLEHVIVSLTGTLGKTCILVDYDHFVQSPNTELMKIEKGLDLRIDPIELEKFKAEFLDKNLRHTVYQLDDLNLNNLIPPLVRDIYLTLLNVSTGNVLFTDTSLQAKIFQWENKFSRLTPVYILIDKLDAKAERITTQPAERDTLLDDKTRHMVYWVINILRHICTRIIRLMIG